MKDVSATILPPLPIVGKLKIVKSGPGTLIAAYPTLEKKTKILDTFEESCFEKFKLFLRGEIKVIDIPVDLVGVSTFQKKVLEEMKDIPYGTVRSYKDLAHRLESHAYQAVGSSCGKNPLLLIYPCHRVISSSGLGGFAYGQKMKRALLELEGVLLSYETGMTKETLGIDGARH